jgi:hypothetical protein
MHGQEEEFWENWLEWSDLYGVTDSYEPHGHRLENLTTEERSMFGELLRLYRQSWFEPSNPILRTEGDQVVSIDSVIVEDIIFEHVLLMVEAARDSRVKAVKVQSDAADRPNSHNVTLTVEVSGDVARVQLIEQPGEDDV